MIADDWDELLDDLFTGCAIAAFVEVAVATGGPPDSEAVRVRAYALYEDALAERNARKSAALPADQPA